MRSSRAWSFFSAGRQLLKNQDILQTAVKTAVIRALWKDSVDVHSQLAVFTSLALLRAFTFAALARPRSAFARRSWPRSAFGICEARQRRTMPGAKRFTWSAELERHFEEAVAKLGVSHTKPQAYNQKLS